MRLHAGGTLEIARWILGWGDAVEVLRPAALRARVRAALRAAARPYGIDRVRLDRTRRR
jgi:predicted DNA-binding transcriptional regulator YafY